MIVFEEELKKFHPAREISDVENEIQLHDISDILDLLLSEQNAGNMGQGRDASLKDRE